MNSEKWDRLINAFAIIVIGIVLLFTIVRLFFGAELSDEAYAVAETYMVSEGALPFVNNWSQMPGFTLILAPFVKLYTLIVGGTDGIFLFFRFLSFFINALTAITVSYVLKEHIKSLRVLALCSLIYVCATGWDYVGAFRGDRLAIDLLAVGVMLLVRFYTDSSKNRWGLFAGGIFLALAVLCYPVVAVEVCYFVIVIIYLCHKKEKSYKSLLWFIAGALLATVVVVGYLSINSGFFDIFRGIRYLLNDVTYFQLKNDSSDKLTGYFKDMVHQVLYLLLLSVGCFMCIMVAGFIIFRKNFVKKDSEYYCIKRIYLARVGLISLIGGICLDHLLQIWRYGTADNINISIMAMTIETFAVPFVWLFIKNSKSLCRFLMGFIWFPTYIWVVVTGVGTYSSMSGRHPLLKNAAFLLGVFVYFAICDVFFDISNTKDSENEVYDNTGMIYKLFVKAVLVMMMAAILFTYLFNSYTYVYRDDSVWRLNTVVSAGPYKGMRTTDIRAQGLIELDRIIDSYVEEDDYVLAMDNDPFIYLMSKGKICTPCTWDQALYSYGFDQPDLYYDYFKVIGTEPTKIIYFNYGRDEIMSIDIEYKFNEYVRNNYELIYEDRNIFEWRYCGKDIVCELLIFDKK